jgi:predicted transcriptional regulator
VPRADTYRCVPRGSNAPGLTPANSNPALGEDPRGLAGGWMGGSVRTAGGKSKAAVKSTNIRPKFGLASLSQQCYVRATMSDTTTIRLPPKLRARLRSIAKETDRSVHSLIVEAVEKHAAYEEQMRAFVKEALEAGEEIDRTGEVYRAEDVHAWMDRLAQGVASPRPKPWRK